MKITTTASGKKEVKMSKSEWENIGKKAGWGDDFEDPKPVVTHDIDYKAAPYGYIATIPAGTPVIRATNLPPESEIKYWAESWDNMSEQAQGWQRNYGFGLSESEVSIGCGNEDDTMGQLSRQLYKDFLE